MSASVDALQSPDAASRLQHATHADALVRGSTQGREHRLRKRKRDRAEPKTALVALRLCRPTRRHLRSSHIARPPQSAVPIIVSVGRPPCPPTWTFVSFNSCERMGWGRRAIRELQSHYEARRSSPHALRAKCSRTCANSKKHMRHNQACATQAMLRRHQAASTYDANRTRSLFVGGRGKHATAGCPRAWTRCLCEAMRHAGCPSVRARWLEVAWGPAASPLGAAKGRDQSGASTAAGRRRHSVATHADH